MLCTEVGCCMRPGGVIFFCEVLHGFYAVCAVHVSAVVRGCFVVRSMLGIEMCVVL